MGVRVVLQSGSSGYFMRVSHLPAGAEEAGGGPLELAKRQAAVAVGVEGPHPPLHLVKYWSNNGQILVKYWSNNGRRRWRRWRRRPAPAPPPGRTPSAHRSSAVQFGSNLTPKCGSNTGQGI